MRDCIIVSLVKVQCFISFLAALFCLKTLNQFPSRILRSLYSQKKASFNICSLCAIILRKPITHKSSHNHCSSTPGSLRLSFIVSSLSGGSQFSYAIKTSRVVYVECFLTCARVFFLQQTKTECLVKLL